MKVSKHISLILLIALAITACDKDYNSIESDVLGEQNTSLNANNTNLKILAYNKKLDSLQINNLGSSLLGFFDDPIYGQTTASIITQITPAINSPDFGDNPVIDSVILNIPYFSRPTGNLNEDNTPIYTLKDSTYGNINAPIKLTIYRNNYFLRDYDLSTGDPNSQKFYSNASNPDIENNYAITDNSIINFDIHKGEVLYETDASGFIPSPKATVLVSTNNDGSEFKTISAPAFRVNLANDDSKKAYWTSLIIDKQDDPVLSNSNNFKNYFRGLYFKAESISNDGQMVLLNTSSQEAKITIYYSRDKKDSDPLEREQSFYVLNLTENRLNTYINTYSLNLQNGDKVSGDEKIYLKGIEGSMAIVDLFNGLVDCEETNTEETALDCFKKTYRRLYKDGYVLKSGETVGEDGYILNNGDFVQKRIINEAQLIIFEDESIINTDDLKNKHKYDRIYAFDIENNLPTYDYLVDGTENLSDQKNSNFISLGKRTTDNSGVSKYKIRITEHLNRILVNDSTNTKLGLVLSNNVNITRNSDILESKDIVTKVPTASILSPRGTVLHGNNINVPDNRKMKLVIYLTEPKE